jgi:hypothetical protein
MFQNLFKEKPSLDQELDLYKKKRMLEIDQEVGEYKVQRQLEMVDMAKRCAEELGEYEHNYHHSKELKGIEIAKLEAKLEALAQTVKAREEVITADNNLLKSKDAEIKRLSDLLTLALKERNLIIMPNKA